MATLWIREYAASGAQPVPVEPELNDQTVSFTTTTQSGKFAAGTNLITFVADAAFHYKVGESPTATTANLKVPADTMRTIKVPPGYKIAVVTAS